MKEATFSSRRSFLPVIFLLSLVLWPAAATARRGPALSAALTPDNTIIVADPTDARFSQDFSVLLRQLRLAWVLVDIPDLPPGVRDKNVLLVGRLDTPGIGPIIRQLATPAEREAIAGSAAEPVILTKASPWAAGHSVTICTGSDLILTRNAAEQAVRAIIAAAPSASAWIQTTFDHPRDEAAHAAVAQLRFTWDDEELPLAAMLVASGAKPRWRISTADARVDVEHLFSLLAHGYAGYAYFNQQDQFARAKARILAELSTRAAWSGDAFARLLHQQLGFIVDCHMRIGEYPFAGHADFWYDTTLDVTLAAGGYTFVAGDRAYTLLAVAGADPGPYLFPSLNAAGAPVYRLGVLAEEQPPPLSLRAGDGAQERDFTIPLQRSEFDYYSDDIFREDSLGGIPVIRVRSFADVNADALNRFVESARRLRGAPVVVVDIRGNGGGNEAWPVAWIQGLTGRRAESVFITSELHSKTTMAGRANLFVNLAENYPDVTSFAADARHHTSLATAIESGARAPAWTSLRYPSLPLLTNDTTLIIVFNGLVASAGEGMILRASQAENVVLVGENSHGCLTFGNNSTHQLPNSRLSVSLPINFGFFLDGHFREGEGLSPNLWVPAADAVNYAVAAVRSGTITTQQPLTPATRQQPFVPENPWARDQREKVILGLVIALFGAAATIFAYLQRRRPRTIASFGAVWLVFGAVAAYLQHPVGFGFLLAGAICLLWGLFSLLRARPIGDESVA